MAKLDELSIDQLDVLYQEVIKMRKEVLEKVQTYGHNANDLVTQKIERDIEAVYGKKCLQTNTQDGKT